MATKVLTKNGLDTFWAKVKGKISSDIGDTYWANVKVSSTSNNNTEPTFAGATIRDYIDIGSTSAPGNQYKLSAVIGRNNTNPRLVLKSTSSNTEIANFSRGGSTVLSDLSFFNAQNDLSNLSSTPAITNIFGYDTTKHAFRLRGNFYVDGIIDSSTSYIWKNGSGNDTAILSNGTVVTANGTGSIALGVNNGDGLVSSGIGSIAHGDVETGIISAYGNGSYAGGYNDAVDPDSEISAAEIGAHAEGCCEGGSGIVACGKGAHAEGFTDEGKILAFGDGSHAEGYCTEARNMAEHAQGKYNKSNQKTNGSAAENAAGTTLHSVGIGTSDNDKKNAFEIMQNGDAYLYGVGGYDGTNPSTSGVKTLQTVITGMFSYDSNTGTLTITTT